MKVVVAGSRGLAGAAIVDEFHDAGFEVVGLHRGIVDLTDSLKTNELISKIKPNLIVNAAAKVGGIQANNLYPVEHLLQNLKIQNNLFESAHTNSVDRVVFLGSSCVYPKNAKQPLKETDLLSGHLEPTNSAYAIAKIAGIELLKAYRKQFGKNWIALMPSNLYGRGDNFNLESAHVLPALIRKFVEAKARSESSVTLWGTGTPLREFLHVKDMAKAVVLASKKYNEDLQLNIGTGTEISILELANKIAALVKYEGSIVWDTSKPDGVHRKVLDITRVSRLGWAPEISLNDGLLDTIEWYVDQNNRDGVRL
jgi:GDP-L-fucose synthase